MQKGEASFKGQHNETRIYKIIVQNERIKEIEIIKQLKKRDVPGRTKPSVHKHLQRLIDKGKIFQIKKEYYVNDVNLQSKLVYAHRVEEASHKIIDNGLIEPKHDYKMFRSTYDDNLRDRTKGISVSNNYCETKFRDSDLPEKLVFEFANRVGAFLTYLFIESNRPLVKEETDQDNRSKSKTENTDELASRLIRSVVGKDTDYLDSIYKDFCRIFPALNLGSIQRHGGLKKEQFDDLINAYKGVYPSLYEGLERYYSEYCEGLLIGGKHSVKEYTDCKHEWEEYKLYKFTGTLPTRQKPVDIVKELYYRKKRRSKPRNFGDGKLQQQYYYCRKCHYLSDSPVEIPRLTPDNQLES